MANSTWNVSASGDWSDATDWTGGVPNSTSATATIAQSGTYTVDIAAAESFTVGSVTLNDADATLEIDGTLNLANTLTLTAGTLDLTGTIDGGTINASGGTFDVNGTGATLDGVTVEGTINVGTGNNEGNLTLTGTPVFKGAGGSGPGIIDFGVNGGYLIIPAATTLSNVTINLGSGNFEVIDENSSGTLTLSSSVTINVVAGFGPPDDAIVAGYDTPGTIINDGVMNIGTTTSTAGNSGFEINSNTFENGGTISVTLGDLLEVYSSNFSNTGTISVDGTSTLEFMDELTTGEAGKINVASGGTVQFYGILNNSGATYAVPNGINLGGTISGGTIEGTINAEEVQYPNYVTLTLAGSPTLEGTGGTGAATINVTNQMSVLCLAGTETINNATINVGNLNYGNLIEMVNGGTVTLGSGISIVQSGGSSDFGTLVYLGTNSSLESSGVSASGSLVNDGTIDAGISQGSFYINPPGTFTNAGTINVSGGDTLFVDPGESFSNTGKISIDSTSTVNFEVTVTAAQLGTINAANGATEIFSDLNNTGDIYTMPAGINVFGQISGGTIEGTITIGSGAGLELTNISMEGAGGSGPGIVNVSAGGSLNLGEGTFSNATITLNGTLTTGSAITLNNTTLASNVTVQETAATANASIGGTAVNDGTIDISGHEDAFTIGGNPFTNDGTIEVTNSSVLSIGAFDGTTDFVNNGTITLDSTSVLEYWSSITPSQLGTIDAPSGGDIDFEGGLNNVGSTFVVPTGAAIGGIIEGGTVEGTSGIVSISPVNSSAIELTLEDSPTFEGAGGTGPGVINNTEASGAILYLEGTETISNVTINVGSTNSSNYAEIVPGETGTVTLASSVTIDQSAPNTYAQIGTVAENMGPIVNDGTIDAAANGGTFLIVLNIPGGATEFTNNGTVTVSNNDFLAFAPDSGAAVNSSGGTITQSGTSSMIIDPSMFTNDGTVSQTGTKSAGFIGADVNIGAYSLAGNFTNNGLVLAASSGGALGIDPNNLTNNGKIEASNGSLIALGGQDDFTNLSGTVLTGGTYEAGAGSKVEFVTTTNIVTDNATLVLNGASSVLELLNVTTATTTTPPVNINTMLTSVGSSGALEILGGQSWTSSGAFTNSGTIELGGGTFTTGSLTSSGTLEGYGTFATAITNSGAVIALGGTLNFSSSINIASGSTLSLTIGAGAGATLQLPGNTSITTDDGTVELLGPGAVIQSLNGSSEVNVESTIKTIGSSGKLEVLGDDTYTTTNAISNAGTVTLGGGTFSSGTLTDSTGSTLSGFGTVASVFSDGGTVSASGGALVFTATGDTFTGALGGQEVDFGGGTDALNAGTSLTAGTISVYGGAAVTLATSQSFTGAFKLGSGSVALGANTLTLSGAGSTVGGTISGTGSLAFTGGSQTISGGASLSTPNWTISGNDTVTVGQNLTYGGTFSAGVGTVLSIASGDTLTLTGKSTFGGTVSGAGTLALSSGTDTFSGASFTVSNLSLSSGVVATLSSSTSSSSDVSQATGTTLALGANTLTLTGTGSTFAGTISGSGTLALGGGSQSFNTGATLGAGTWTMSGGDSVSLNENLNYGGIFSEGAGTKLTIASGDTLQFTGTSSFAGSVGGEGALAFSGGADAWNAGTSIAAATSIMGSAVVTVGGNASETSSLWLAKSASMSIGAGNTFSLSGTASAMAGTISGAGTLALTGGTLGLDAGASIATSNWTMSGGASFSLGGNETYDGAFSQAAGTRLILASGDTFTLTGSSTMAGSTIGTGTLAFSGGTDAWNTGFEVSSTTMIANAAAISVGGNVSDSGAMSLAAGTSIAIAAGGTLSLSGSGSNLAGTISGAGTLVFGNGSQSLNSDASLSVADWSIEGTSAVTLNESLNYAGTLWLAPHAVVTVEAGDTFSLSGAASAMAGTISGAGTLALTSGLGLDAGASLTTANWTVSGNASISVGENLTYAGTFSQGSGTRFIIASGDTLEFTGTSTEAGAIIGAGTLALSGGTDIWNTGTSISAADTTLSNGVALSIDGNVTDSSHISAAAGTTMTVASGDTFTLTGSTVTLAGAVSGAGTFAFGAGSETLNAGASFSVADWSIEGTSAVTLDESLSYAGVVWFAPHATMTIAAGDTLSLTDAGVQLDGTLEGAGTADVSKATLSGLVIGGTATLADTGTITQSGTVTIGNAGSQAATLSIGAGDSYDISGAGQIALGGSASSVIDDNGLLYNSSGSGTTTISVAIVDGGIVEAKTGMLDLAQGVSGSGTMEIAANAQMEFGASTASTLELVFQGADATLALQSPSSFAATIGGFAATDTIDLVDILATSATLETGDKLAIMNGGTTVATLQLTGNYASDIFSAVSDGHGGTDITVAAAGGAAITPIEEPSTTFDIHAADWHLI